MRAAVALLLLVVAWAPVTRAAEDAPASKEVDHLALAAVLLDDGHVDRAARELEEVSPDDEAVDAARFWTLLGLVELKRNRLPEAAEALDAALDAGQTAPVAWVLLAQARYRLEDWEGTLEALDAAGPEAVDRPALVEMRAQALWRLERRPEAYDALVEGARRFPDVPELTRQRIRLLVELGLFLEAADLGRRHLERLDAGPEAWVAIAEALRRGRSHEEAARLLEAANLHFPADERVSIALARAHLDAGRALAAAQIFERASACHPALAADAVELYRRAGKHLRALFLNSRVVDQETKARQRLGILVDLARFESVLALGPRLARLGLGDDDPVRYAMAYAAFRTGAFDEADRWLKGLSDPALFEKAAELRRAMASCTPAPWGCE
ncbi:MAG: tetratricopeptide repeat protein [Myxococcota bacterium]